MSRASFRLMSPWYSCIILASLSLEELIQLGPGILQGVVPTLLSNNDGRLQVGSLNGELQRLETGSAHWNHPHPSPTHSLRFWSRDAHLHPSDSLFLF